MYILNVLYLKVYMWFKSILLRGESYVCIFVNVIIYIYHIYL